MKKITVIVAVYNAEKYLHECLDSIKNQTYTNLEIICVNDGSKDKSLEILEEYAQIDGRFKIFTKENEGLGGASARNYGLDKATGDYISILDSDDFFDLKMYEKAIDKAENTNADIVVFGGFEYDERNGKIHDVGSILNRRVIPQKEVFSYKDCADDIYQLSQGMAWNKLYKKEFIDKHGLRFQRIKYTDDAFFTFAHMVLAERITVISENLCYYRVNTGTSQTDGLNNYPDSSYLPYRELKKALVTWGVYEDVKRSFVNCVASFLRYFYDKISRYDSFEYLHNKFRQGIFEELDIACADREFFYDPRVWLWVRQVMENSSGDMLIKSARAHGSESTTGILRFRFPFEKIERDSKIVLIGAGIMGRHFYSQIMLSGYCDIVCWAEQENPAELKYISKLEDIKNCQFDYAVIAYVQPRLIEAAMDVLNEMRFDNAKIIKGGLL